MTPRFRDHREHADAIVRAAIAAAHPGEAVRTHWRTLPQRPTLMVAIGKASRAMADSALGLAGISQLTCIITAPPEHAARSSVPDVAVLPCDHPLPTERNVRAARMIVTSITDMHRRHGSDWQLLLLVSGGGSAHLSLPAGRLTLDDLRRLNHDLQLAGADIHELNTVRKHTELLKGGRLVALAHPARVFGLVLSDVIGDPLGVIASGPASPDPTTYCDAFAVLEHRGLGILTHDDQSGRHGAVVRHLREGIRGVHQETPKPGDPVFASTEVRVIANNVCALNASVECLHSLGFRVDAVLPGVTGRAADAARVLTSNSDGVPPFCRVLGGETTVVVGTATGTGGPSQEFALAAALELEKHSQTPRGKVALLAFSTDGIDGPTDAAGAIVTHETCAKIRAAGIDPTVALACHDSHGALGRVGALLRTGPTGTNVNHVAVLLAYSPEP